jgi:sRNA-binding regulator protein Hfq
MANQSAVPSHDEDDEELLQGSSIPTIPPSGPRKLIRPTLPESIRSRRIYSRRDTPLLTHQQVPIGGHGESSHAETFYLQKQIHAQTQMIFMLEGGERLEGSIEWYDTDTIKVRHGNVRTLIYKPSIKYLYKAGESQP